MIEPPAALSFAETEKEPETGRGHPMNIRYHILEGLEEGDMVVTFASTDSNQSSLGNTHTLASDLS